MIGNNRQSRPRKNTRLIYNIFYENNSAFPLQILKEEEEKKKKECTDWNDYYALANAGVVMADTFNVFMDANKPASAYPNNPADTHRALKAFEKILQQFVNKHGQLPAIEKFREVELDRLPTKKHSFMPSLRTHKGKAAAAAASR